MITDFMIVSSLFVGAFILGAVLWFALAISGQISDREEQAGEERRS